MGSWGRCWKFCLAAATWGVAFSFFLLIYYFSLIFVSAHLFTYFIYLCHAIFKCHGVAGGTFVANLFITFSHTATTTTVALSFNMVALLQSRIFLRLTRVTKGIWRVLQWPVNYGSKCKQRFLLARHCVRQQIQIHNNKRTLTFSPTCPNHLKVHIVPKLN